MQLLGRMFDAVLRDRRERITIVGATSGDTGSAAIEACRDRAQLDVVILHPSGRTSEVQRRQMTTVPAANIVNIAVDGTFDDCQDLVKAMFADAPFRRELHLSAVNSINWARVAAQIPYYVAAAVALGSPDREVAFSVPTGNFGNVLAAWAARRMGVPIARLVVGSNRNDILTRFLLTNDMSIRTVEPSLSPSHGHSGEQQFRAPAVRAARPRPRRPRRGPCANSVRRDGWTCRMRRGTGRERCSRGFRLDDEETGAEIRRLWGQGYLADPHSAIGIAAARAHRFEHVPTVAAATAHPAKFPDAMEAAIGQRPPLPQRLADLYDRPERFIRGPSRPRRHRGGGARFCSKERRMTDAIRTTRLPSGLTVVTETMDRVETGLVRRLCRDGDAQRDRGRERRVAFSGTHGVQGDDETECGADRRDDRECWRSHERLHGARADRLLRQAAEGGFGARRGHYRRHPDAQRVRARRVGARAGGDPAGDRPGPTTRRTTSSSTISRKPRSPASRWAVRCSGPRRISAVWRATSSPATCAGIMQPATWSWRRRARCSMRRWSRLAREHFADLPSDMPGRFAAGAYAGGEFREARELDQVHIVLGFPSVAFADPDYYPALLPQHAAGRRHVVAAVPGDSREARPGLFDLLVQCAVHRRRAVRDLRRNRREGGRGADARHLGRVAQGADRRDAGGS